MEWPIDPGLPWDKAIALLRQACTRRRSAAAWLLLGLRLMEGRKMDSFLIRGGNRLKGKVEISGSKNSALPLIAASLMATSKTTLKGVPRLSDIDSMNKLICELGCHVYRHEPPASATDLPSLDGP